MQTNEFNECVFIANDDAVTWLQCPATLQQVYRFTGALWQWLAATNFLNLLVQVFWSVLHSPMMG